MDYRWCTTVTDRFVQASLCVACCDGPNCDMSSATVGELFNEENLIACSGSIQIPHLFADYIWGVMMCSYVISNITRF